IELFDFMETDETGKVHRHICNHKGNIA
ncbi:hypothetical protein HKBW3S47_02148, partial [Candidatus Hakubella thermalkaliphila]